MLRSPLNHTPTVTSSHSLFLPGGGVPETREAPSFEGASFIFGAGQKKGELGVRMVDQRALGGLDRLTTPAPMSAMTAKVRKATW